MTRRSTAIYPDDPTDSAGDTDPPPPIESKPAKPITPLAEAGKLSAALDDITKRETSTIANTRARYQAERDELMATASEKAKRILAAATVEEVEA